MKRYRLYLRSCLGVLVLSALLSGCGGADDRGRFQDNFDDPGGSWGTVRRGEVERGYKHGAYFIALHEPNWFTWASSGKSFDDVNVEVDARRASGVADCHFGILCRYEDEANFYYFAISADGYYGIFRRRDGDMTLLTGDGRMLPSNAIRTAEQDNHIMAVCHGNELSLYVNGQFLDTVTDDAHVQGSVGLGAGSGASPDVEVQFDNFIASSTSSP